MHAGDVTNWVGLFALVVNVVDRLVGQWLARGTAAAAAPAAYGPPTTLAQVEQWARDHQLVPPRE